ncbi:MAG TPA: hypothetical protein P5268_04340 [Candidatus Marinimicrobia bacterium]|nr:hypothetical protein [Candidatus Neomarinimicrobiota bacterium]HRS51380.1 hypothetical protein [Candidatus Neomarinimicrobiota bacterium]HRU92248.1 hypothetical protein [Candidatus Neomarinimicrobiota bacterium]
MKSSILWNIYKPYFDRVWSKLRYVKIDYRRTAAIFFCLLLFGCSEKIPTLPLNKNLCSFDSVSVSANFIMDTTIFAEPNIGFNSYLVVGTDDNLTAYSLLLFNTLGAPLDTLPLDKILSCELVLVTGNYLLNDTAIHPSLEMTIASMEGEGVADWSEDSTNSTNFSLENYSLTEWKTFTYSDADTLVLDLTIPFIAKWRDTTQSHYGIVIKPADRSDAGLGIIYSGETNYYPRIIISYKGNDGDTITTTLAGIEDVTITEFKKNLETLPQPLLISSGKAAYTFLKLRVEELITDKNLFIAGANLYLYVNSELTEDYGSSHTIYITLLDSAEWEGGSFSPSVSSYITSRTFSANDSVLTLKIPGTVQLFTSGNISNFGVALWISPSGLYPAMLGFYPSEDSNPARRPRMEILTMQEE